jgi:hypothetical protein
MSAEMTVCWCAWGDLGALARVATAAVLSQPAEDMPKKSPGLRCKGW